MAVVFSTSRGSMFSMKPAEQLAWFEENVAFFESIEHEHLSLAVPTCDGWKIENLLTHLSFGLGVCYPIAAATSPEADSESVFANADRSSSMAVGVDALTTFRTNMISCVDLLGAMEPDSPCWTYDGPGTVSFWIRRAAVETTIHRHDAEVALGRMPSVPSRERVSDGIDETLVFAFELACKKIGRPASTLRISATDFALERSIGTGGTSATIIGNGHALLLSLWGRPQPDSVEVDGDQDSGAEWLNLVSRAFAGR